MLAGGGDDSLLLATWGGAPRGVARARRGGGAPSPPGASSFALGDDDDDDDDDDLSLDVGGSGLAIQSALDSTITGQESPASRGSSLPAGRAVRAAAQSGPDRSRSDPALHAQPLNSPFPDRMATAPGATEEERSVSWRNTVPEASITLPPSGAAALVARDVSPPLSNTVLAAAAAGLLLALGLLITVAVRNGGVLDLRRPGQMLAVTFGRARPEALVAGPITLSGVRDSVYLNKEGKDLYLVEGEVLNTSDSVFRRVRITVRLLDQDAGRVLRAREVPAGGWLDPAQLFGITQRAQLDGAYLELDRRTEQLTIAPGERAPFLSAFAELPEGAHRRSLAFDARVTEMREAQDGGP